jgi:DnaK suppressor protein
VLASAAATGGHVGRSLARSTLERFRKKLESERERLLEIIREIEEEREEVRLTETSSERSPDPNTAEGGSLAFEMEKELSLAENAVSLLDQVDEALERIEGDGYGNCESCGAPIPVARLEALPYTKLCIDCASDRR